MKKKTKETNESKIRYTKEGTRVLLKQKMTDGIYLVEAITRNGVFITQVAEEDLA